MLSKYPMSDIALGMQVLWLFLLALPVACITWTVTHEEVFRESRDFCVKQSKSRHAFVRRKFFYIFTCEYCFSHYVTILILAITRYKLLYADWRGYLIAGPALIWIANQYMSIFSRLRLDIQREREEIKGVQAVGEEKVRDIRGVAHRSGRRAD